MGLNLDTHTASGMSLFISATLNPMDSTLIAAIIKILFSPPLNPPPCYGTELGHTHSIGNVTIHLSDSESYGFYTNRSYYYILFFMPSNPRTLYLEASTLLKNHQSRNIEKKMQL